MEREQTWIRAIQRRNSREAAEQLIRKLPSIAASTKQGSDIVDKPVDGTLPAANSLGK